MIQCDQTVEKRSHWMDMFRGIVIVVSLFMTFYLPALPLAVPDYIFSLQYECDKEDGAKAETIDSLSLRRNGCGSREEEGVPGELNRGKVEETGASEIPVDDSSPVTCSALLQAYIQKLPDSRLSFKIKLAVMLYCILPCVVYVEIGLWLTFKKKYIYESLQIAKHTTSLISLVLLALLSLVLLMFLRPKDLLFRHEMCWLCRRWTLPGTIPFPTPTVYFPRKSPDSIGNEILCHLRMVQQLPAFVWTTSTQLHMCLWEKLLSFSTCLLSMDNHHESRLKRALCVSCVLFFTWPTILIGLFGTCLILLLILNIAVCLLLTLFSPFGTLCQLLYHHAETYSISSVISTVSVFVSGVIPRLLFKGMTNGKVFIGWEKIKMKREIKIAVEEFDAEKPGANSASGSMESSEILHSDQV